MPPVIGNGGLKLEADFPVPRNGMGNCGAELERMRRVIWHWKLAVAVRYDGES